VPTKPKVKTKADKLDIDIDRVTDNLLTLLIRKHSKHARAVLDRLGEPPSGEEDLIDEDKSSVSCSK